LKAVREIFAPFEARLASCPSLIQAHQGSYAMTPVQIEAVKKSWSEVVPIADQAAVLFYERLFTLDPSLRALFKPDMTEQRKMLMTMLGTAVGGLDRLDTIVPAVQALGRRHNEYGVT